MASDNGVAKSPEPELQSLIPDGEEYDPAETEPLVDVANADAETDSVAPTEAEAPEGSGAEKKWPGWPGDCVFRMIVPVLKVGSIIGRKGELIKKMCEETRARIKILDGAVGTPDRVVLISGKEEPEVPLSPAMEGAIRVFKRVSGLSEGEEEGKDSAVVGATFCSIRLLVASTQAINLIGKQGSMIKSIQEGTGASIRVLSGDDVPFYAARDERIIELQGEGLKVLKALEAVVGHLRKFLVDHSVIPLFEKSLNAPAAPERPVEPSYAHFGKRDSLYIGRDTQMESQMQSSGISMYGPDPSLSGIRSSAFNHGGAIVSQITQTMRIPLSYAEDIIGIEGSNIEYIRRSSGAILTVQETRGFPDEITVELKGTPSQVQLAQQLIQEVISNHKEPNPSSYPGLRPNYAQYPPPPALPPQSYASSVPAQAQPYNGAYASSNTPGYATFRL